MPEIAVGHVFAGHRIEAVAGRGGMGVVYRATQLDLLRTVALKVVAPGLLADEAIRRRFVRESRVAASLEHPNVIPIHYAGEEDGTAYIVMRFVDGDDLRQLTAREGPLPPARAAALVAQVAAALDAAHAAGLVHRDVKPANVLVAPGDHVYLTDFGLTKHALSVGAETGTGRMVGTVDYAAPEQIRGDRVDARTDVYALGCLLYYVLTGTLPFPLDGHQAKMWAHLTSTPPAPSATMAGVPAAFDEVIRRALAKDPDDRYPSAGDLGRAALAAAQGEEVTKTGERAVARGDAAVTEAAPEGATVAMPPSPEPAPEVRAPSRRPALIAGLAVAVLGVGVVAGFALLGDDEDPGSRRIVGMPSPIEVDRRPNTVAVAGGRAWVGSAGTGRLTAVDETERAVVERVEVGEGVADLAAGEGALWAAISRQRRVVRLDPETGRQVRGPIGIDGTPLAVAVGHDAVWVAVDDPGPGPDGKLVRIDPRRHGVTNTIPVTAGITDLAAARSGVWVLSRRPSELTRVDPESGLPDDPVRLGGRETSHVAYGGGALWATIPDTDDVARMEERTLEVATTAVGDGPSGIAVLGDHVWVANRRDSTLSRLDLASGRSDGDPFEAPANPFALAAGDGRLWVTSLGESAVQPVPQNVGARIG